MKMFTVLMLSVVVVSTSLAGRPGCKIPLSKTDQGFKFSASSSSFGREPTNAYIDGPTSRGWCAKTETKYKEFLQVNLTNLRHISAVKTQGFEYSYRDFYVKQFLLGYSIDGVKWKFYKSRAKKGGKAMPWTTLTDQTFVGNSDTSTSSWNELHPSFVAKYVRIYPLRFWNGMCMKLELYGCTKSIDCTHVLKLDENEKLNITSPSYPSAPPRGRHCNWFISLPKPNTQVSLASLDFDVGGSNSSVNNTSCLRNVVKVYKDLHSFSKFLVGAYCNSTNHMMPRILNISSQYLRIIFDVGDDTLKPHRGFSFRVWIKHKDIKIAQSCENSTITLDCRGHESNIQVTDVFYGQRPKSDVCSSRNTTNLVTTAKTASCRVPDVLPKLQNSCDHRNVCMISNEKQTFPHGCTTSGPMEMFVIYKCNATERVVITSSLPVSTSVVKSSTGVSSRTPSADEVTTSHKHGVVTTPLQPTTIPSTAAPPYPVEENTTLNPHDATTSEILKHKENILKLPVTLIAAVAGTVFLFIVVVVVTCVCRKKTRKEDEKAQVSKKGVVPSASLQSKGGSNDSLYEKIDDLECELDHVRYETEPNKYSPLHGMTENPLYEKEESTRPCPSYDIPVAAGTRVLYVGTTDNTEPNYIDNFKSPDELPSNSIPMAKYLEPPKSPPAFTSIIIPTEIPSESAETPVRSPSAEELYETMDGSLA